MMRVYQSALAAAMLSTLLPARMPAQEEALRRYFEGKEVIVKLDMPGDVSGVDVNLDEENPVDFREVGNRIRQYGVSLKKGTPVMVTTVKVKKRLIEFQLGGGGYGSFSDMMSQPSLPSTYVPKTRREQDLENQRKNVTDPAERRKIDVELDQLRRERQRAEAQLQAQAAQTEVLRKSTEREKRLTSGSRFNLRSRRDLPADLLTPAGLQEALKDWVEFPESAAGRTERPARLAERPAAAAAAAPAGGASGAAPAPTALRKGLTEAEVNAMYGKPKSRNSEEVAGMKVVRSLYDLPDAELSAHFVEGVLTKYTLSAK